MVSEHGWDYNTKSGPPQSWDHGKDAQSYYHVTNWFDIVMRSDTTIGNAELSGSAESLSTANSITATSQAKECSSEELVPSNGASEAVINAFLIIGHDDRSGEMKKISGVGDGWMAEDTAPGIVQEGRIWRGVKTFRVPVFREIQITEEPNVGSESGAQAKAGLGYSRGGYRGRNRGRNNYRGRGNLGGINRSASGGGIPAERWAATRGW